MLTWIQPLIAGNAVRMIVTPPAGAVLWRILRRTADAFTGHNDPGAVWAYEGSDNCIVDTHALVNGTAYYYRAYWFDGVAWHDAGVRSVVPVYDVNDGGNDVLTLLRERIEVGMAAELRAGRLRHPENQIKVLTAPPQTEDTVLPVVTVKLSQDAPAERDVGDDFLGFVQGDESYLDFGETEGWLSRVVIDVVGWAINPDERIAIRKSLRRVVQANMPVFSDRGLTLIEFSQRDENDMESYNVPMYQSVGAFSCLAPEFVYGGTPDVIRDVPVTVNSDGHP
jgi:hypothetical protein